MLKLNLVPNAKHLRKVWNDSSSTGCTFYELWFLYDYVRKNRPKKILELGCGVSTAVICAAVAENKKEGHACRFVSMEEHPGYLEDLKKLISPALLQHVELVQSPVCVKEFEHYQGCYYRDTPVDDYDFIFVDAPYGPHVPRKEGFLFFDADVLELMLNINSKPFVVIDGRQPTVKSYSDFTAVPMKRKMGLTFFHAQASDFHPGILERWRSLKAQDYGYAAN